MLKLKAYKFRLYPDEEQQEYFSKCFGCTRFIYNKMLADKIEYYKETKEMLHNSPSQYKKEYLWLKEVDSLALANAQMNLDKAYKNFFRDKSIGFPKFKRKKKNKCSYTTNNQNRTVYIDGNYIKLPKLKSMIKIKQHRQFDGLIKSCTISKTPTNKYFISILVEEEIKPLPKTNNLIGIDLGIKEFAITSNDEHIENPKWLSKSKKKLAKLQRELSRKSIGSNNRNKARIKVAKQHECITNQRKDFLQKLSTHVIRDNDIICIEDLQVKNMIRNKNYSKQISDVSWSEFVRQLQYKADWYGKTIQKVDTYFASSQLCNVCGYKNKDVKDTSIREWTCPECGSWHNRDYNASKNILDEGLRILKTRVA